MAAQRRKQGRVASQDGAFASDRRRTDALLQQRAGRAPDHAGEAEVLRRLSAALAERPSEILQTLAEEAMAFCSAGSAGVSLIKPDNSGFYWPAIAGAWSGFAGGGMPRDASPCARVLDEDATLVFIDPAETFPVILGVEPVIREVLLSPFHFKGKAVGTVWLLSHDKDRSFDREDVRRLESLAGFAASAYHAFSEGGSGLRPTSPADRREAERLDALYAYDILDTEPEPEFDDLVRLATHIFGTRVAVLSFVDADRQWFKARVGFDRTSGPRYDSVGAVAAEGDEDIVVIPDLTADPRTRTKPLVVDGPALRFYAGAVLKSPSGHRLGALSAMDSAPRPQGLTDDQTKALALLVRQIMALLELRRAVGMRDVVLVDQHRAAAGVAERLRAAESRLRSAQSAARLGAFEIEVGSEDVFATPEFSRVFGLDVRDSHKAELIRSLVLPQDRAIASTVNSLASGSAATDVEYRIQRPSDGAMRWVLRRGAFERDDAGRPLRLVGVVEDVTDRKLAEARVAALVSLGDALRDAETTADAVAAASRLVGETLGVTRVGYAVIDIAAELFNIQGGWSAEPGDRILGKFPFAVFPSTAQRLRVGTPVIAYRIPVDWSAAEQEAYREIGASAMITLPLFGKGVLEGVMFVHSAATRTWEPAEIAFVQAVADRTHASVAKLQAENDQRLLNLELSHRMKNTMAVVQSIAQMTLRRSAPPEAMKAFDERLSALADAQDVLLGQNGVTARIGSVAEAAFAAHGLDRVTTQGPELNLNARSALNLAMMLHELVTNASKYGALSNATGRIDLVWRIVGSGPQAQLALNWREVGGPAVSPPTRSGFGSRLLKVGFGGDSRSVLAHAVEGVTADFTVPLAQVLER